MTGVDLRDLYAAIGANAILMTRIKDRAEALKRQAGEGMLTDLGAGGEVYRLLRAVRAGTDATLARTDGLVAVPPSDPMPWTRPPGDPGSAG